MRRSFTKQKTIRTRILGRLTGAAAALLILGVPAYGASAGIVATESSPLNVRSGPGTAYERIASLPKGSAVTLNAFADGWYAVSYADGEETRTGYVCADYIEDAGGREAVVQTGGGNLNVRAEPWGEIVGRLAEGSEVLVMAGDGGWGRVLYQGNRTGYVSLDYITYAPENQEMEEKYPAIQLAVPAYKQFDSRWGGLTVGQSGETVRAVGCTLTCVAMSETYRTGNMVTPRYVVTQYDFTASGALYWPSWYTRSWDGDFLEAAYAKLAQGIPTIVEGKNSRGISHFVLVTGFTGGELTPEGFVISDPASYTRTTLADFFADYPVYVKRISY